MSNLYWLSEAQMERLKPFFPKSHGKPCQSARNLDPLSASKNDPFGASG